MGLREKWREREAWLADDEEEDLEEPDYVEETTSEASFPLEEKSAGTALSVEEAPSSEDNPSEVAGDEDFSYSESTTSSLSWSLWLTVILLLAAVAILLAPSVAESPSAVQPSATPTMSGPVSSGL